MKILARLLLILSLLISCSNEKEIVEKNPQEIEFTPEANVRGAIPSNHPLYKVIYLNYNNYNLTDIDEAYKKYIANDINKGYTSNLKNESFILVIKKGLIKNGSEAQKKFYIKEQQGLILNLPTIVPFYSLLLSSNKFMAKEEMRSIAKAFYEKNKEAIESCQWPDEDTKKNTLMHIDSSYNEFCTSSLFIYN